MSPYASSFFHYSFASMKVPPKRKGNWRACRSGRWRAGRLNESPSQKEGKSARVFDLDSSIYASMKVPPKRKGNRGLGNDADSVKVSLNESPSQKEGKLLSYPRFCGAIETPQ